MPDVKKKPTSAFGGLGGLGVGGYTMIGGGDGCGIGYHSPMKCLILMRYQASERQYQQERCQIIKQR